MAAKLQKIIDNLTMIMLKKCFFGVTKTLSLQCNGHQTDDNIVAEGA